MPIPQRRQRKGSSLMALPQMISKATALAACALAAAWVAATGAFAGDFSVSPVRVYMTPSERGASITIVNNGDTELAIETELFEWDQKSGGAFDLKPTEDLIVAPPQMRIAPKSRQVIRLARLVPPDLARQRTYRVLVRELPGAAKAQAQAGYQLQLSVNFSIPIFFTPTGFKPQLACSLGPSSAAPGSKETAVSQQNATVGDAPIGSLRCQNSGNAHALVVRARLEAAGQTVAAAKVPGYVLTNRDNAWSLFAVRAGQTNIEPGRYTLVLSYEDESELSLDVTAP